MINLIVFEQHPEFISASRRARDLALLFHATTGVARAIVGWTVLVSPAVMASLAPSDDDSVQDAGDDYSVLYNDYSQREVVEPLLAEIQSDQDAWARSEEGGWFYGD